MALNDFPKQAIFSKNGNTKPLLNSDDSLDFSPSYCMLMDIKYGDPRFWDTVFSDVDKEYMYSQIIEFKKFKWDKNIIKSGITVYTSKQVKKYSRSIIKAQRKLEKGKINENNFPFYLIIRKSVPIFNKRGNLVIIFSSFYSGPLSASGSIDVYLLVNGKWRLIASETKYIS